MNGCVLNNVAYSKNCHNGSFEIMRCPSKQAPCGSMSCWFIYTPHHLYSILYIKVTIRGTLPNEQQNVLVGPSPGSATYDVVGWQTEKWVAVNNVGNKIAKLVLEMQKDEKKTMTTGETWAMGAGYEMTINACLLYT